MSRKYCTKHNRSKSRYHKRLEDRGLSKAPRMRVFDEKRATSTAPGKAWARESAT